MTDPTQDLARTAEIAAAFDDLGRSFAAYRDTNDARLAAVERRGSADILVEEKLARIDAAIDTTQAEMRALSLKAARLPLGAGMADRAAEGAPHREHKAAFETYVRRGEAQALIALEAKAFSAGSGPDGGFLVPQPAEREILRRLALVSPIRALASVRQVSTATFKKALSPTALSTGWVAETAARPQTNTPQLTDLTFATFEIYAQPAATQTLLDDAAVDIETWVADEVEMAFAEAEGAAFVNGDGTTRPRGFLAYTNVPNGSWTSGNVGYLATGVSGAFAAANPSDILVDLVYAAKAGYRQNGTFVMNRKTQSVIRKFKDAQGNYLWQPPAVVGAPASLMNFPVIEAEDMPDIAANSFSVAFGDFKRGYLIVDRLGIRMLRDPYTAKPYVLFYTTKRIGGGVQDYDAIKLLKFGVS